MISDRKQEKKKQVSADLPVLPALSVIQFPGDFVCWKKVWTMSLQDF